MEENKNTRQTIARTGGASSKIGNTNISKIIEENVAKSIDENISKIGNPEISANYTPVELSDKADASEEAVAEENIFSAVYNEKKIQEEQQKNEESETEEKSEKPVVADNGNNNDEKFKTVFILLIIITVVIFLASGIYLLLNILGKDTPDEQDVIPENTISASLSSPFEYQRLYGVDFPAGIQEKYKLLYAQNQDFVGWLSIPNTSIDMPVYQCDNNSYYLKHDNFDTYTKYGTLFMDMNNDAMNLTRNTTIYGHNFDNKLIFDELHNYRDPEFFKKSPVIEFNTLYKDYKWKVIAAFHTNGESAGDNNYLFYYIASSFGNNSFMKFYDELQQRSYIHTGVDVQPTDKVLTLSTCTYFFDRNGALENARFVVVARLVRDGESAEVDVNRVTVNDNVRYPQLYYTVFGGTNPWRNASKWVPELN